MLEMSLNIETRICTFEASGSSRRLPVAAGACSQLQRRSTS